MSTADCLAAALRQRLPGWAITHYDRQVIPAVLRLRGPDGTGGVLRVWDRRVGNVDGAGNFTWADPIPNHCDPGGLDRLAAYLRRCVEPAEEVSDG